MIPRKLKLGFSFFSYGGNGGLSSEHPDIRSWYVKTILAASKDERIESCVEIDIADTPITMGRNRAVLWARQHGVDVLVMVDSDQKPDMLLGLPGVKPFFPSSFDFIYNGYDKGPHVVGAPYCGPPPNELVYVFRWERKSNLPCLTNDLSIGKYTRSEAAVLSGILPCGGLPTGLIMYDMRIFDTTEPKDVEIGSAPRGWFYYEWKDRWASEKLSTEDGTATRDMAQIGFQKLGYNPVYCNWDSWAGHWKPYCVGKPHPIRLESTTDLFADAVRENIGHNDRLEVRGDSGSSVGDFFANELSQLGLKSGFDDWARLGNAAEADMAAQHSLVETYAKDGVVAEVGTFAGQTAKRFVQSGAKVVYCVDHFEGSPNDITSYLSRHGVRGVFMRNCRPELTSGSIRLIEMPSPQSAACFDDGSLDMVYIDANHDYESVKADIAAWLPKVKPGGILSGHDYGNLVQAAGEELFPGVRRAVDESFGTKVNIPIEGSSIWWIVKE